MKRVVIAGMLASVLAAGCGGDGGGDAATPAPKADIVEIKAFQFGPDPITVKPGATVTFKNLDATVHTVVAGTRKQADRQRFDESLEQDASTTITFERPGTYDYFCDRHSGPGMAGKVVVQ